MVNSLLIVPSVISHVAGVTVTPDAVGAVNVPFARFAPVKVTLAVPVGSYDFKEIEPDDAERVRVGVTSFFTLTVYSVAEPVKPIVAVPI